MFDALGEEHEGKSDLKEAEIGNDQPIGGGRGFLQNEGGAKYGGDNTGNQIAFRRHAVFLSAEGNDHHRRGQSAQNGKQVPVETVCAEFIPEEQHQSHKNNEHGKPVRAGGLFAQEPEREQYNIDRCGVLQEDRVRGGGHFCGCDEQELGQDERPCRRQLPAIPFGGKSPQVDKKRNACEDASPAKNCDWLPIEQFDQYSAGAP